MSDTAELRPQECQEGPPPQHSDVVRGEEYEQYEQVVYRCGVRPNAIFHAKYRCDP
jgi:hypothetical protein